MSTLQTILENLHIAADGLQEGEETLPDALSDIKETLNDCIAWIEGFPDKQAYSDKVWDFARARLAIVWHTSRLCVLPAVRRTGRAGAWPFWALRRSSEFGELSSQ